MLGEEAFSMEEIIQRAHPRVEGTPEGQEVGSLEEIMLQIGVNISVR